MATLSPGTVVQLKSGGPKMTVTRIVDENQIIVTWFDSATRQRNDAAFPAAVLDIVSGG